MTIRKLSKLMGLAIAALVFVGQMGQAESGQAAYHLHTDEMVTASRYEPRGSVLRVTNPQNGESVIVRVNDRGPFNGNRILDLSTGAFRQLYGGLGRGVGSMSYEVISRGSSGSRELSSRGGSAAKRYKRHNRHRRHRSHYRRR